MTILGSLALMTMPSIVGMAGVGVPAGLGGMFGILGAVILIIGIVQHVVLYWLWQMKKIGWTLTMILEINSIIMTLLSAMWTGIIIPVIIVIYLWMKKDLFK